MPGTGHRGPFSRHLLHAHRFEFLLESLAPSSHKNVLTRGGSAVQRGEVNRRRQTYPTPFMNRAWTPWGLNGSGPLYIR